MDTKIQLISDFKDYYDASFCDLTEPNIADPQSTPQGILTYTRNKSDIMSRGKGLNWLRNHNILTIETKPVNQFEREDNLLVVYTNPSLHGGNGKLVVTWQEAITEYGSCLASKFIENTQGVSLKYLQIGSRKFRVMMKNDDWENSVTPGIVTSVDELQSDFNENISIPIFSIDYVSRNNEMVAIDFNEVQSLSSIGFDSLLKPEEVYAEVEKALSRHR